MQLVANNQQGKFAHLLWKGEKVKLGAETFVMLSPNSIYIELTFEIQHWPFCVSQLVPLVQTESEGKPAINSSYFSTINPADGQCLLEKFSDKHSGCNFGLLGNLYACEGKTGKVIIFLVFDK